MVFLRKTIKQNKKKEQAHFYLYIVKKKEKKKRNVSWFMFYSKLVFNFNNYSNYKLYYNFVCLKGIEFNEINLYTFVWKLNMLTLPKFCLHDNYLQL